MSALRYGGLRVAAKRFSDQPSHVSQRCFGFGEDVVGRDVEVFEAGGAGGAGAVGVHADEAAGVADIVVPALADGGFAGYAGLDFRREDGGFVGLVLLFEQFPRRHADDAACDALGD